KLTERYRRGRNSVLRQRLHMHAIVVQVARRRRQRIDTLLTEGVGNRDVARVVGEGRAHRVRRLPLLLGYTPALIALVGVFDTRPDGRRIGDRLQQPAQLEIVIERGPRWVIVIGNDGPHVVVAVVDCNQFRGSQTAVLVVVVIDAASAPVGE